MILVGSLRLLLLLGASAQTQTEIDELVRQLALPTPGERKLAARKLRLFGRIAVPALSEASNSNDKVVASEANLVLSQIELDNVNAEIRAKLESSRNNTQGESPPPNEREQGNATTIVFTSILTLLAILLLARYVWFRLSALGRLSLARTYFIRGDHNTAQRHLDYAIKLSPTLADSYLMRAQLKLSKGYLNEAFRDLSDAIRISPDLSIAYVRRGELRERRGDFFGAKMDYDKAIELNHNGEAFFGRGRISEREGDKESALENYSAAIESDLVDDELFVKRGMCYLEEGDVEEARRDFDAAIRVNDECVGARFGRALILRSKGLPDEASRELENALRTCANDDPWRTKIEDLLRENRGRSSGSDCQQV